MFNSLPNDKILDFSEKRALILQTTIQVLLKVWDLKFGCERIENIVGKGDKSYFFSIEKRLNCVSNSLMFNCPFNSSFFLLAFFFVYALKSSFMVRFL